MRLAFDPGVITEWLRDPVTERFLEILADEARTNREAAVEMATVDEPGKAKSHAVWCASLRWAITDGVQILADEAELKARREKAENPPENGYEFGEQEEQ